MIYSCIYGFYRQAYLGNESYEHSRVHSIDALKAATKKYQSAVGIIVKLMELTSVGAMMPL